MKSAYEASHEIIRLNGYIAALRGVLRTCTNPNDREKIRERIRKSSKRLSKLRGGL